MILAITSAVIFGASLLRVLQKPVPYRSMIRSGLWLAAMLVFLSLARATVPAPTTNEFIEPSDAPREPHIPAHRTPILPSRTEEATETRDEAKPGEGAPQSTLQVPTTNIPQETAPDTIESGTKEETSSETEIMEEERATVETSEALDEPEGPETPTNPEPEEPATPANPQPEEPPANPEPEEPETMSNPEPDVVQAEAEASALVEEETAVVEEEPVDEAVTEDKASEPSAEEPSEEQSTEASESRSEVIEDPTVEEHAPETGEDEAQGEDVQRQPAQSESAVHEEGPRESEAEEDEAESPPTESDDEPQEGGKGGSLADFFNKVNKGEKSQNLEATMEAAGRIYEAQGGGLLDAKIDPDYPKPYAGVWGQHRPERPRADLSTLFLLFQELFLTELLPDGADPEAEAASMHDKAKTLTEEAAQADKVVPPLESKPKSVNLEFVEGLDDIDKLFEEIDPPDELDISAAGSSIQEVVLGQGTRIAVKRIRMGAVALRELAIKLKDDVVRLVKERDIQIKRPTREQVETFARDSAIKIKEVSILVYEKAQELIESLMEGDDDEYEFEDEDFEFGQQQPPVDDAEMSAEMREMLLRQMQQQQR